MAEPTDEEIQTQRQLVARLGELGFVLPGSHGHGTRVVPTASATATQSRPSCTGPPLGSGPAPRQTSP
jgi:hypothetical protein